MSRDSITVIAAACNESEQAQSWLDQLDWVDRVVVVDTGSVDGTREIFVEAGVEVLEGEPGLIHRAKNRAIRSVTSGWILDLDLDERVPLPLQAEILEVLDGASERVAAYRLPFRHYVFGRWLRHGGWRTKHLRLYRAGQARYPEDRAHSTLEVEGEIDELSEAVVHFAHPLLHDFLVKMNRYTSQDAPLTLEHGRGGLRNRPPLPERRWPWFRASAGVFWNRYLKSAGFRDGLPGFVVATLLAYYVFVEQAKLWEARHGGVERPTQA